MRYYSSVALVATNDMHYALPTFTTKLKYSLFRLILGGSEDFSRENAAKDIFWNVWMCQMTTLECLAHFGGGFLD